MSRSTKNGITSTKLGELLSALPADVFTRHEEAVEFLLEQREQFGERETVDKLYREGKEADRMAITLLQEVFSDDLPDAPTPPWVEFMSALVGIHEDRRRRTDEISAMRLTNKVAVADAYADLARECQARVEEACLRFDQERFSTPIEVQGKKDPMARALCAEHVHRHALDLARTDFTGLALSSSAHAHPWRDYYKVLHLATYVELSAALLLCEPAEPRLAKAFWNTNRTIYRFDIHSMMKDLVQGRPIPAEMVDRASSIADEEEGFHARR